MLIDTHCHLTEPPLCDTVAEVLARARVAGIEKVIVPAYDLASWIDIEELARTFADAGIFVAYGVHPWVAGEPLTTAMLEDALHRPRVVAVGEIGLDSKIEGADLDQQLKTLELQLEVAAEGNLPVLLHCRGAFDPLLRLLAMMERRGRAVRGVIHAFSRSPELARRFLDLGFFLAFGGTITHPQARARQALVKAPLDRILLETDAPSIGLKGVLAAQTEPAHVRTIAATVATLRGETLENIARKTTENAQSLFAFDGRYPAESTHKDRGYARRGGDPPPD